MFRQLRMWAMSPDLAPFAGTVVVPAPREQEEVEGMVTFFTAVSFTLPAAGTAPPPLPDDEMRALVSSPVFLCPSSSDLWLIWSTSVP